MRRPLSLLPALLAAATAVPLLVLPAGPAAAAPAEEEETDPLAVTISSLTPGEIPERGPVRMRGRVTNVSDERWRAVNVHAFVGYGPMTTSEELEQAREVPAATDVGQRIFIEGTFDAIGGLEPGESASYEVVLKRNQIPVSEPGVYWFGAHALGNTDEVRDDVADGRARTFLPLLPEQVDDPVETSLVVPLRRQVQHTRTGRVAGERGWVRDLSSSGYLSRLADFGAAANQRPFGWLVDPALPDTVARLADGNAPRSLADTAPIAPDGPTPEEPSDSGTTEASAGVSPTGIARAPAAEWLERLPGVLDHGRTLALPYGDLDVSAATAHGRALLRDAWTRSGDRLAEPDVATLPAVAPPQGYLSPEALAQLPSGTHTLLGDQVLPEDTDDGPRSVDDRRVLFTATDVARGGPGPDDPLGTVALRQRILAEAAVRALGEQPTPLVVLLPETWAPQRATAFWRGLTVPWLRLTDPTSLTSSDAVDPDALDYPPEQRAAELPAANFVAAEATVRAGDVLANVLTNNDEIDQDVVAEALTSLSYADRADPERSRQRSVQTLTWLERRSRAVRVDAPPGVTLSSASGKFAATLTNRLDHQVTISLKAISDASLSVDTPQTIDLAARGSQSVLLDARAGTPGVHYVRLVVTDDTGAPLGSSARLPVRSAQVSQVIWLILGVGVGLLFLAIAVRLLRRLRSGTA